MCTIDVMFVSPTKPLQLQHLHMLGSGPPNHGMRLHLDFVFPIAIDAYSRYIEAHLMQALTSATTTEKLRSIFATGIPAVLVSDNGPSLVSAIPAELLMNRRLGSLVELVRPARGDKVGQKQTIQKEYHNKHARDRVFTESDQVYVRGYSGQKWIPAVLIERTVSWKVKTQD